MVMRNKNKSSIYWMVMQIPEHGMTEWVKGKMHRIQSLEETRWQGLTEQSKAPLLQV